MELARKEMEKIVASQKIKIAKESRAKQMEVFDIPPGDKVLVYREKSKKWEGPYKLYKYDNYKTAFVTIGKGVEPFSITAVKKYLTEEENDDGILSKEASRKMPDIGNRVEVFWPKDEKYYPGIITAIDPETQKRHVDYDDGDKEILDFSKEKWRITRAGGLEHEKCTINKVLTSIKQKSSSKIRNSSSIYIVVIVYDPTDPRFLESSREEIQGLLDRGTYVVVNESDVPPGATVLKSRVVHSIKVDSKGNEKYKTRLVTQGHLDPEKGKIVNEAPTNLRSSTRLISSIASTLNFKI